MQSKYKFILKNIFFEVVFHLTVKYIHIWYKFAASCLPHYNNKKSFLYYTDNCYDTQTHFEGYLSMLDSPL